MAADEVARRNKELALAVWGRDLNGGPDPDGDEFVRTFREHHTEDYWNHASEPGQDRGLANARHVRKAFRALFTDAKFEIDTAVAEGDLVMLKGMFSAQHTGGTLFGIPATGKHVSQEHVHILRFRDGKISEHWVVRDDYTMYKQVEKTAPESSGGIVRFAEESGKITWQGRERAT